MRKYLCILLLLVADLCHSMNTVKDYQRIFLPVYTNEGQLALALRVFKMNDVPSFLLVNPESLKTSIVPVSKLKPRGTLSKEKPGYFTHWNVTSTRYYQLLNKSTASPYLLENQGIKHAEQIGEGNVLTIDLCPSSKPFEHDFFNKLVQLSEISKKPTPITIAVSGLWLIEHPEEFHWLITKEKDHKLDITWANHSFSHVYYKDLPYSQNFMLSEGTNIDAEILLTEQYLIESGELPSVFFRFPGLVSDAHLVNQIKKYGLLPVGTDAWMYYLEKFRQAITPGGIILVHGNSNEHEGIKRIMPILNDLKLMDIKSSI